MGRVFSPERIRDEQIPQDGAHYEAGRYVLEALFDPPGLWVQISDTQRRLDYDVHRRVAGIKGGMVYGSTALGSPNLRSDLDVLVTYYPNYPQALQTMQEAFLMAERQFSVPVEHHIVPVTALFSPLQHTIDPLFAKHLVAVQEQDDPRWSYNWPVDQLQGLKIDDQQVRALAIRYCSAKRRQLINGLVDYRGTPNYAIFQRALELPAAIGRKVLAATDGHETVDQELLQNKHEIVGTLHDRYNASRTEFMGEPDKSLADLCDLDDEYTDLLQDTIGGEVSMDNYRIWLETRFTIALKLGIHVASSWVDILEYGLDKPAEDFAELQLPDTDTVDY